jgi:hypothetical protein
VLSNAIESPLEIRGLRTALVRGEHEVAGTLQGLDLAAPVVLAPAGKLSFRVAPAAPLGGEGAIDAVFDLTEVHVRADRDALWAVILDPGTPGTYSKRVTVRALPALFQAASDRPTDAIGALTVEFEGGGTVELNPEHLSAEADLRLPIADLVLRRADQGVYRYRVTLIRASGQSADPEWRSATTTILFPEVQR